MRHIFQSLWWTTLLVFICTTNASTQAPLFSRTLSSSLVSRQVKRTSQAFSRRNYIDNSNDCYSLYHGSAIRATTPCSIASSTASSPAAASLASVLLRGALLRIASDLTGGTVFEAIKTRVCTTREGPREALRNIIHNSQQHDSDNNNSSNNKRNVWALWTGSEARVVEGALVGAVFMLTATTTKQQILALGGSRLTAALASGLLGGVAQAIVMTPAGLVFTSLNYHRGRPGYEHDTAWSVTRRVVAERGVRGMYYGAGPMALRQATNWASRAGLTELARTTLGLSAMGIVGEIGSGILGGLGSCWNTPVETARVLTQRDVSAGRTPKTMLGYWTEILDNGESVRGLYRGITPRAMQAIWQTCFMVVIPNILGV